MDKRIRNLIFGTGLLAALLAVYFLTADLNNADNPANTGEPAEEGYSLVGLDAGDIESISLNPAGISFIRRNNTWAVESQDGFRLNTLEVTTLSYNIANLTGFSIVSGNPADYGLDPAAFTADVRFIDGTEVIINLGDITPDGLYYYCQIEGDDNIYTVRYGNGQRMTRDLNGFVDYLAPTIDLTELTEASIKVKGKTYAFSEGYPQGVEFMGWQRSEFISSGEAEGKIIDMEYVNNEILSGFSEMTITGYVKGGYDNLSDYGLDEPAISMYLGGTEKSISLFAGNVDESGNRYVIFEDEPYLYTMGNAFFTVLENIDESLLFNRRIINVVSKQAESVLISNGESEIELNPMAKESDALKYAAVYELLWDTYIEEFDISDKEPVWTVDIKGRLIPSDFNPQQVAANKGSYTENGDNSLSYSIRYDFYEYDTLFYAVSADGKPARFVIDKNQADNLARVFE